MRNLFHGLLAGVVVLILVYGLNAGWRWGVIALMLGIIFYGLFANPWERISPSRHESVAPRKMTKRPRKRNSY